MSLVPGVMNLALQPISLDMQKPARVDTPSIQWLSVTRAVSRGRGPVCRSPVAHGAADEEPNSTEGLYSTDFRVGPSPAGARGGANRCPACRSRRDRRSHGLPELGLRRWQAVCDRIVIGFEF